MNAPPLHTGIGVTGKAVYPDGFYLKHDRPVDDTVTKRKFENDTFFRFVEGEDMVFRCFVSMAGKFPVKFFQVLFQMGAILQNVVTVTLSKRSAIERFTQIVD